MDEETMSLARLPHDQPYSTRLSPPLDYRNTQASSLSANVPELDRRDSRRRLGQGGEGEGNPRMRVPGWS